MGINWSMLSISGGIGRWVSKKETSGSRTLPLLFSN